jgi:hypothetical protein
MLRVLRQLGQMDSDPPLVCRVSIAVKALRFQLGMVPLDGARFIFECAMFPQDTVGLGLRRHDAPPFLLGAVAGWGGQQYHVPSASAKENAAVALLMSGGLQRCQLSGSGSASAAIRRRDHRPGYAPDRGRPACGKGR